MDLENEIKQIKAMLQQLLDKQNQVKKTKVCDYDTSLLSERFAAIYKDSGVFMSNTELLSKLQIDGLTTIALGRHLSKSGIERATVQNQRGWLI